jgi:hypothetical protein
MDARIQEANADGKAGAQVQVDELVPNVFYYLDADALHALCHGIEDLALEEANGTVLAAFQDFSNFEAHEELYTHLSATIDGVEIIGTGAGPGRMRNIKFTQDASRLCREFWLVLYQGKHTQAVVLCRQSNTAQALDEKQFIGFYSFNPVLIARVRQQMADLARGQTELLREFIRLQAIDRAAKQIHGEFRRQTEAIDAAMRRLQLDGKGCPTGDFTSVLEEGLSQLHQWKNRVPELIARAETD